MPFRHLCNVYQKFKWNFKLLKTPIWITAAMSLTKCVAFLVLHVYKYIHSTECYKTLTSKVFCRPSYLLLYCSKVSEAAAILV